TDASRAPEAARAPDVSVRDAAHRGGAPALGGAPAGGRGRLRRVDRGRPEAPSVVPGFARGQAGGSSGARAAGANRKRGPVSHSGVSGLAEARGRVARPVSAAALDPHPPRPPGAGALEPARLVHHVAERLPRHETAAVV